MTSVRRIEMDCPVLPAPIQAKESRAQLMESTARYTSTGEKDRRWWRSGENQVRGSQLRTGM